MGRIFVGTLYLLCAVLCAVLLGAILSDSAWREHLVEKGLGRWSVDEKTGAREFKVGPPTQEKP
jgi:predicted secreted Zn-dependent protease